MRTFDSRIERMRITQGPLASTPADGRNGAFSFSLKDVTIFCIVSDGSSWEESDLSGQPWEHVSVSLGKYATRCPTWEEMAYVKNVFFKSSECVVEFHPAKRDYISHHDFCLHLWRPCDGVFPTPPSICVGLKKK